MYDERDEDFRLADQVSLYSSFGQSPKCSLSHISALCLSCIRHRALNKRESVKVHYASKSVHFEADMLLAF